MRINRSRPLVAALALAAISAAATLVRAHMVYVVPDADVPPTQAEVFVSESLTREQGMDGKLVKDAKLQARKADGTDAPLALHDAGADGWIVEIPAGTAVLHGSDEMGVNARGGVPNRLVYHPKAIVGDGFAASATVGSPIELSPRRSAAGVALAVLVDGKSKPNVEVTVLAPGGGQRELTTDASGVTPPLDEAGRWGAWARNFVDAPGEVDGKPYKQVRHYATLVLEVAAADVVASSTTTKSTVQAAEASTRPAVAADASATRPARADGGARNPHSFGETISALKATPTDWKLPEATSSFGAVAADGWLYVYGGHVAPTHEYHTAAVSGGFWRRDLADPRATWQELPAATPMQGTNLAAADGMIYRVGGMAPANEKGEEADVRSLAEASVYDPAAKAWQALPALPEPRSSHDLVAIGRTLFVIGGWNVQGSTSDPKGWPDAMLTLDLGDAAATWQTVPQPFLRRALIAASHGGRLFVIGGFDAQDRPSRRVDIYDPGTQSWTRGPGLPGSPINGFSPAACVQDNQLYVSVFDGNVYRLNDDENRWEPVATGTSRIVHRMVPNGGRLLILGGATRGGNLDWVEEVTLTPAKTDSTAASR